MSINLQPTLEDDLIILRPLRSTDFEALFAIANDPMVWEQHQFKDRYKIEVFSKLFEDSIKSKGALVTIDKTSTSVIGSSRFKLLDNAEGAIEIGWSFLSRKYWGGQYNRSMKRLMIDHAFQFVTDVIFYVDMHNIRSQKAVAKIGGKRITEPNYKHLIKISETDWTYRIHKADWNR